MMNTPEHYCTFYLDGSRYGVSLESIRDIVSCRGMVPMMRSPSGVRGLLGVEGEHLLVVDLGQVLQGSFLRVANDGATALIVDAAEGRLALMVDRVGEVVRGRAGLEFGIGPWSPRRPTRAADMQNDTLTVLDVDGMDILDPELAA